MTGNISQNGSVKGVDSARDLTYEGMPYRVLRHGSLALELVRKTIMAAPMECESLCFKHDCFEYESSVTETID